MSESFSQWACSASRTLEERFGAQRLIEHFTGIPVAKDANGQTNYEAERLWRKERALNPAYEPDFTAEAAREVEGKLGELTDLSRHPYGDERPVRDVSFLRFCPALEALDLGHTEVRDWSPVTGLRALKKLDINDRVACDLRPVGELARLESLQLYLHCPWPDLSGCDRLVALRHLHFRGNPLALAAIRRLPAVRTADVQHWLDFKVPLRDLHDLPEMPELRTLELINTWRLDGIERSPHLLNVEIYGYFEDLTPLSKLPELTHLMVSGVRYETLEPLAKLPELRWLKVRNEDPQDYSVLAEMAKLHEVEVELCPASKVEVAALNAGLIPWSGTFAVDVPRKLAPLRLLLDNKDGEPDDESRPVPRDWGENAAMGKSEARWFAREVNRRLNALLGKGWGHCESRFCSSPGSDFVTITRLEDIDRLREVVDTLRALLASTRHPWRIALHVDSLARYERDMDEIEADDDDGEQEEFNAEREREEWEDQQRRIRERREFFERKHRLRLQQQFGGEIRPKDFAPPKPPEEDEERATAGGVADSPPEYDLGTELRCYMTVMERGCYVPEHSREMAEMLLDLKAIEPPESEG